MSSSTATSAPSVTIFVHVHYPDIWADIRIELERRLAIPFHLVVTSAIAGFVLDPPGSPFLVSARLIRTENRGRDIRPFLCALAELPDCDLGLKLHTKKSPQRLDGAAWRNAVLDSLLPPDNAALVARLRADPRLGLVAPTNFTLSVQRWLLLNEPKMVKAMALLGKELVETDLEDAYFAAGSMFWFRRQSLAMLTGPAILASFEEEKGQHDGTMAHAMERLFPVEVRRSGFVSLAVAAVMASTPDMTATELLALAREHADIPSSYFLRPGVREYIPNPDPAPPPSKPQKRLAADKLRSLLRPRPWSWSTPRSLTTNVPAPPGTVPPI